MIYAMMLLMPATALPAVSTFTGASIAIATVPKAKAFVAACAPAVIADSSALPVAAAAAATTSVSSASSDAIPTATCALESPKTISVDSKDPTANSPRAAAHTSATPLSSLPGQDDDFSAILDQPRAPPLTASAPTPRQIAISIAIAIVRAAPPPPSRSPLSIPRALANYKRVDDLLTVMYKEYLLRHHAPMEAPFMETVDAIVNKLHVAHDRREFQLGYDGAIVDVVVGALLHFDRVDDAYAALVDKWLPFYEWFERKLPSATELRVRAVRRRLLEMLHVRSVQY